MGGIAQTIFIEEVVYILAIGTGTDSMFMVRLMVLRSVSKKMRMKLIIMMITSNGGQSLKKKMPK